MNQPVSARAESAPKTTHTQSTYFLAVDDPFELKIAQAWLKATYPNTLARIVSQLPMQRLTKPTVVIPVIRGEDRSPAYTQTMEAHSVRAIHVNPKDLIGEVRECAPVEVAKHWREVRDEFDPFGGEMNRNSFMDELSQNSAPVAARIHIGNTQVVRLQFV